MKQKTAIKRGLRICVAVFLLFVLALGSLSCGKDSFLKGNGPKKSSEPSEASRPDALESFQRIVQLIEIDDNEQLLKWVHPNAVKRYGREQIVERADKIHRDLGLIKISLSNPEEMGSGSDKEMRVFTANARYETAYGTAEKKSSFNLLWHPARARWELDWTPAVILPGLGDKGIVRIETLKAQRGSIYDRSGRILAADGQVLELSVVPGRFKREDIPKIAEVFAVEESLIHDKLNQTWVTDQTAVPLFRRAKLESGQYELATKYNLQIKLETARLYPLGEAAAQLIGYVGTVAAADLKKSENENLSEGDRIGRRGLELLYEQKLRAHDGFRVTLGGAQPQVFLERNAQNGKNIYLNIDADLQEQIYALTAKKNMSVTAINSSTGEILALVSTPSFDPFLLSSGMSGKDYQALLDNPDLPLSAKFEYTLSPGSTQKLFTAVAALNSGTLKAEERVYIGGKQWQASPAWGKYFVTRFLEKNQALNLSDALAYSDNIYFAQVGLKLGAERFQKEMERLFVGQTLCPDYSFPTGQISNRPDALKSDILLADSAYGQGEILLSPLNIASIYGALANGGVLMQPRLLQESPAKILISDLLRSEAELKSIQNGLRRVVTETYGKILQREGLSLAGKSGTAELGEDKDGEMRLNSWFVGYDMKQPQLLLAVTSFNSQNEEELTAIKTFGDIFEKLWQKGAYRAPALKKIGEP